MSATPEASPPKGPDVKKTFEQRFHSLEASNVTVATHIKDLTEALQVIAALELEQRAQAAQMAKNKRETDLRLNRTRQSVNVVSTAMGLLLPLVSMFVYLILIEHVNDLLEENYSDRRASCISRNAGSQASIDRERALGKFEPDPQLKRIHLDSAEELAKSLVDCGKLFPQQDN